MARVFFIPLFLILFLVGLGILSLPVRAHAAEEGNLPLWQSIRDYEDKYAFDLYGPPMPERAAKFEQETRLYQDMIEYFDEAAEDEPDFTFIVNAYDVPIDAFRPEIIRPQGEAVKESEQNPFGEDDPLPEAVQSTSTYVDEVRPTFLPGGPLKQRNSNDIQLGDEQLGSLFAESDKLKREAHPEAKKAEETKPKNLAGLEPNAGAIDVPKKPLPGSNEETLLALKKAVKELGLEKQLNLGGEGKEAVAQAQKEPEKPAAVTPLPAEVSKAAPAKPAVHSVKKKPHKKKRTRPHRSGVAKPLGTATPPEVSEPDSSTPPENSSEESTKGSE